MPLALSVRVVWMSAVEKPRNEIVQVRIKRTNVRKTSDCDHYNSMFLTMRLFFVIFMPHRKF